MSSGTYRNCRSNSFFQSNFSKKPRKQKSLELAEAWRGMSRLSQCKAARECRSLFALTDSQVRKVRKFSNQNAEKVGSLWLWLVSLCREECTCTLFCTLARTDVLQQWAELWTGLESEHVQELQQWKHRGSALNFSILATLNIHWLLQVI